MKSLRFVLFFVVVATVAGAARPTLPAYAAQTRPCSAVEYRQFDFWLGDWKVVDPSGKPQGSNLVTAIQNNCVLQEHWHGTDGSAGTSFNLYDAATKQWHQTWVDNAGGLLLLNGGLRNGAMVLSQHRPLRNGGTVLERITWTRLSPNKVRQLWDRSKDDGKSWTVIFDGIYIRR